MFMQKLNTRGFSFLFFQVVLQSWHIETTFANYQCCGLTQRLTFFKDLVTRRCVFKGGVMADCIMGD